MREKKSALNLPGPVRRAAAHNKQINMSYIKKSSWALIKTLPYYILSGSPLYMGSSATDSKAPACIIICTLKKGAIEDDLYPLH